MAPISNKQRILRAAYLLFLQKGYTNTSLSDIASESGVSKSLVQKHFKKKEAFVEALLRDLLNFADQFLSSHDMITDNYWVNLQLVGQVHYAFLLSDSRHRQLFLDLLEIRNLTERMIRLDLEWAFEYMHEFPDDDKESLFDDMTLVMGGTYELVYRFMKEKRSIDIDELQRKSLGLTMFLRGISRKEIDGILRRGRINQETLDAAVQYIEGQFLSKAKK